MEEIYRALLKYPKISNHRANCRGFRNLFFYNADIPGPEKEKSKQTRSRRNKNKIGGRNRRLSYLRLYRTRVGFAPLIIAFWS